MIVHLLEMKEMQNGMKHLQMEKSSMENVWMVIMGQFQEIAFKMVQWEIGVQLLVLVMVFL